MQVVDSSGVGASALRNDFIDEPISGCGSSCIDREVIIASSDK